jgi:hypothetical protein
MRVPGVWRIVSSVDGHATAPSGSPVRLTVKPTQVHFAAAKLTEISRTSWTAAHRHHELAVRSVMCQGTVVATRELS